MENNWIKEVILDELQTISDQKDNVFKSALSVVAYLFLKLPLVNN